MTIGAYMGVIFALGLVLLLLGVTLRFLQRFAPGAGRGRTRIPMELVQRLPLGPKQGIAVVRVGERLVAVSLGEGGVRRLFELDEADAAAVLTTDEPLAAVGAPNRVDFAGLLGRAVKTAGFGALAMMIAAASAQAQAPMSLVRQAGAAASSAPLGGAGAAGGVAGAVAEQTMKAIGAQVAKNAPKAAALGSESVKDAGADLKVDKLAPQLDLRVGGGAGAAGSGLRLSGTVGVVVMMGLLTLLPTLLLMMTSFTRILIVLHFLRQALGTQNAPPAHLVAAMALLLTGFVMAPTLEQVNKDALQPWMAGQIEQGEMLSRGAVPFRAFMLRQTRPRDLETFVALGKGPRPATAAQVPLVTVMSAFVTSELRTSFQIGFALFLPFIIIDVVVSSVLMSMGMFMLPPAMIALPFKLLLFVLCDGWTLMVQSLVASFR